MKVMVPKVAPPSSDGLTMATASTSARRRLWRQRFLPNLMVAPFSVLFIAFFAVPLCYSVYISMKSEQTGAFIGFQNYKYVFGLSDFWSGVERMLYFGVIQVTFMVLCGLALALFLDSPYCRGKRIFGLVYFLPYAIPGVIAAIMWGFLFSPQLDQLLGIGRDLGLAHGAFQPLGSSTVLYAIMFIVTWEFTGYNMTIYLTGLSSVPKEVIDAARIDGASEWAIARRVKLPLLRKTIIFTVVLAIIGTLQLFNEPSIINDLVPLGAAFTPNLLIYNTAFGLGNISLAAAESVVLALIIVVASLAFFRIVRIQEGRSRKVSGLQRKWPVRRRANLASEG